MMVGVSVDQIGARIWEASFRIGQTVDSACLRVTVSHVKYSSTMD